MKVTCPSCGKVFSTRQKNGKRLGRPPVTTYSTDETRFKLIVQRVKDNLCSLGTAAQESHISKTTVKRLVDGTHVSFLDKGGN